jgi:sulfur carrier protein
MVVINGQPRDVPDGTPVAAVVARLVGRMTGTAVALNGAVLPRTCWADTPLTDGDRMEVLTAVQGG